MISGSSFQPSTYNFLDEPIDFQEEDLLPAIDDIFQTIPPIHIEPSSQKEKSHDQSSSKNEFKEKDSNQRTLTKNERRKEANRLSAKKSRELKAKKLAQLEALKESECHFISQALQFIPASKGTDALAKKLQPKNFSKLSENEQVKTIAKAHGLVLAAMKTRQESLDSDPDKIHVIITRQDLLAESSEEL